MNKKVVKVAPTFTLFPPIYIYQYLPDVYCIFKTELVVVVGEEMSNWGVIPPDNYCVRLGRRGDHFSPCSSARVTLVGGLKSGF